MALIAQSGGKDIGFSTIFQFQALAQFCHGKGEIAGGDVRFRNTGELAFQFLFIKGGNGDDAERPAWKCFDRLLTYEEMTVLGKHLCIISLGKNTKTTGFNQRGIRLTVEIGRASCRERV